MASNFKARIKDLYTGRSVSSVRFRYVLIAFDLATVLYFIIVTPFPRTPAIEIINAVLAVVILADFIARFLISDNRLHHLGRVYVIADAVVLFSLLTNHFFAVDLTFLRILRGLRFAHSDYLLRDLRHDSRFFREHEDAVVAGINLVVFVFVTTTAVYTFFTDAKRGLEGYVDAFYFTITTLTTTGYGDLTPTTIAGKLGSVAIMVIGVSLFVNLARALFTPSKVHYPCLSCGLTRHDPDAIHCKHCGSMIRIETKGQE